MGQSFDTVFARLSELAVSTSLPWSATDEAIHVTSSLAGAASMIDLGLRFLICMLEEVVQVSPLNAKVDSNAQRVHVPDNGWDYLSISAYIEAVDNDEVLEVLGEDPITVFRTSSDEFHVWLPSASAMREDAALALKVIWLHYSRHTNEIHLEDC